MRNRPRELGLVIGALVSLGRLARIDGRAKIRENLRQAARRRARVGGGNQRNFAYLLWFHLLSVSSATAASSYHFMMPPLGMLFGWLLLGEQVGFTDLIGVVPVAIGIYLVTHPATSRSKT